MAPQSQRKAARAQRPRGAGRLVRLQVRAAKQDAALIQALAEALRGEPQKAGALRSALENALTDLDIKTAFDVFGADLPDETFAGVFDQPRQGGWRKIDL